MKRKIGLGIFFGLILIISLFYFFSINTLPSSLSIIKGNESTFNINFPFSLHIQKSGRGIGLKINGQVLGQKEFRIKENQLQVKGDKVGSTSLNVRLFGIIPLRTINVNVLPDVKVYPGGQAIGVLLRSKGVMVVGKSFVEGKDGRKYYPAVQSGIEVGDTILKINGIEVYDKVKLASLIQKMAPGGKLTLEIKKKDGRIKKIPVNPVKNKQGKYMIGLYVDDGVAGVGTLTFFDPKSGEYGALGHVITETNSQVKIDIRQGKIIEARISGINTGKRGLPGEKLGTFFQTKQILGEIRKNTQYGIYGKLNRLPENPYFNEPIPVLPASQVQEGQAKIYTVIKGGKIEEFDVSIDRVYHQSHPGAKGMIIRITDPQLKKATGGIIQGMSGSPIVQNNKLVGAITHVFVNDPTRGYGVFAEWMVLQTGLYDKARAVQ
ncbi:Peptidase S55 sporulation stage IV protein B [Halothermothrix orenii H 168]|uniref:Peptidase S55 sporulation stage IV protein B n=1 Tax=Halothermothrix orenii (strain H 168 / OCM 544 / DSM 9562) TaxID=373903 RepID=B8D2I8_HALOH|nr:Peptidase S55 sporulation stage IV protein B [Halothermothrix orenii H 168]